MYQTIHFQFFSYIFIIRFLHFLNSLHCRFFLTKPILFAHPFSKFNLKYFYPIFSPSRQFFINSPGRPCWPHRSFLQRHFLHTALFSNAIFSNVLFSNALFSNALFSNALFSNVLFSSPLFSNAFTSCLVGASGFRGCLCCYFIPIFIPLAMFCVMISFGYPAYFNLSIRVFNCVSVSLRFLYNLKTLNASVCMNLQTAVPPSFFGQRSSTARPSGPSPVSAFTLMVWCKKIEK